MIGLRSLLLMLLALSALHAHVPMELEAQVVIQPDGEVTVNLFANPGVLAAMVSATTPRPQTRAALAALLPALRELWRQQLSLSSGGQHYALAWSGSIYELTGKPFDHTPLSRSEQVVLSWTVPATAASGVKLELRLYPGREVIVSCLVRYVRGEAFSDELIGSLATAREPVAISSSRSSETALVVNTSAALSAPAPAAPLTNITITESPHFTWWLRVVSGFTHIIPDGIDHIVFVIGLWLGTRRLGDVLWVVTAFTVAHSLTLGLAVAGVVQLSSGLNTAMEIAIALTIAWIAVENVLMKECSRWRLAVVFGFGLIHGLGFANALADHAWPSGGAFVGALAMTNLGIELGQLTVIAICAAFTMKAWNEPWYRRAYVVPGSVAIGAFGLWWAGQRLVGLIAS